MRKIVALLLVVSFLFIPLNSVYAQDDGVLSLSTSNTVTVDEALEIAKQHILQVMKTPSESSMWNTNVEIVEKRVLFDDDYDISDYYFKVDTVDGQEAGYIIISADKSEYPIKEYSDAGTPFIEAAIEKTTKDVELNQTEVDKDSIKIFSLDNMEYATQITTQDNEKILYDISDSNYNKINELPEAKSKSTDLSLFWENTTTGGSDPSNGDNIIYYPYAGETGYCDSNYCLISGGDLSYYTTGAFNDENNCAPTAATNLCYYYAQARGYWGLKLGTWYGTYNEFYEAMDTNDSCQGTYDGSVPYGYDIVFGVADIGCDATLHYGTDEGQKLVKDLDNNRPCHLIMHAHRLYGDHSVLAVGYVDFTYDSIYNDPSSTYIRIADGWSTNCDRYVWGSCYGTWNYVSVIVD